MSLILVTDGGEGGALTASSVALCPPSWLICLAPASFLPLTTSERPARRSSQRLSQPLAHSKCSGNIHLMDSFIHSTNN